MRMCSVLPTMALLVSNMGGFVINVMKPDNFKAMLKAILAFNIIRESTEVCFNICMIIFKSGRVSSIPREVYFGRFFGNVWWLSLCVSFSKSRWVSKSSRLRFQRDGGGDEYEMEDVGSYSRGVGGRSYKDEDMDTY